MQQYKEPVTLPLIHCVITCACGAKLQIAFENTRLASVACDCGKVYAGRMPPLQMAVDDFAPTLQAIPPGAFEEEMPK